MLCCVSPRTYIFIHTFLLKQIKGIAMTLIIYHLNFLANFIHNYDLFDIHLQWIFAIWIYLFFPLTFESFPKQHILSIDPGDWRNKIIIVLAAPKQVQWIQILCGVSFRQISREWLVGSIQGLQHWDRYSGWVLSTSPSF